MQHNRPIVAQSIDCCTINGSIDGATRSIDSANPSIVHDIYTVSEQMFSMDSTDRTRGHSLKLQKQRCNTTQRQHFFNQRIVEHWNRLPAEIVEAESLDSFKAKIDKHFNAFRHSLEEPPTWFSSGQKISSC